MHQTGDDKYDEDQRHDHFHQWSTWNSLFLVRLYLETRFGSITSYHEGGWFRFVTVSGELAISKDIVKCLLLNFTIGVDLRHFDQFVSHRHTCCSSWISDFLNDGVIIFIEGNAKVSGCVYIGGKRSVFVP